MASARLFADETTAPGARPRARPDQDRPVLGLGQGRPSLGWAGVAGQMEQQSGKHPLQPRNGRRTRANYGTENDDNPRAEEPVAE